MHFKELLVRGRPTTPLQQVRQQQCKKRLSLTLLFPPLLTLTGKAGGITRTFRNKEKRIPEI
jgi:hypothetical protein